jgi:hypothetical protein
MAARRRTAKKRQDEWQSVSKNLAAAPPSRCCAAGSISPAPALKFNAAAGARKALVVDLSGTNFIASMGMRLLLIASKTMAAHGGGRRCLIRHAALAETALARLPNP